MFELLNKFNSGELIGLVAVVGGLLVAAIAILISQWRRVRIAELETALKQQMLDKGMSAADIEKVMNATRNEDDARISATGNESLDKAALVEQMVANGYEGEDIERVLKAYQSPNKHAEEKPFAQKM